jgi:hypothetical protein
LIDAFAMVRNPIFHSDDAVKLHKPLAASKLPTAPDRPVAYRLAS